jgi:type I restriction enzyme S subunit
MSTEELPDHWAEASLGDIVHKLVDGSHNPPPKQSSGLPMLSAVNKSWLSKIGQGFKWKFCSPAALRWL